MPQSRESTGSGRSSAVSPDFLTALIQSGADVRAQAYSLNLGDQRIDFASLLDCGSGASRVRKVAVQALARARAGRADSLVEWYEEL
jgi:hypothetical protein